MNEISDLLVELRQTWQELCGGELRLTNSPQPDPTSPTLSVAIQSGESLIAWLEATPPADRLEVARSLLRSWAILLGKNAYDRQMLYGLTNKLIVAWNRLSFLHQITELMRTTTDPWPLSLEALRFAMEATESENAFFAQLIGNSLTFKWVQAGYETDETSRIVAPLRDSKKILICNDETVCRQMFPNLDTLHSVVGQQLNLMVGSPSFIGLINQQTKSTFDAGDIQIFESLVEQLTAVIDIRALHVQQMETEQLKRDLEIAAKIQASFLPIELPKLPGYDIAATLISASKVGGDFYDIGLSDEQAGLLVCDVAGKGVSAALMAANVQAKIHNQLVIGSDPGHVLQQANRALYQDLTQIERFATAAVVCLPAGGKMLSYASAGHTTSFWIQANPVQVQLLPSMTLPLGILREIEDTSLPVDMKPDDILILYSDGLTEVENEKGQILGMKKAIAALLAARSAPAQFILDSLLAVNRDYRGQAPMVDDLTMIVIKKTAGKAPQPQRLTWLHLPSDLGQLGEVETSLAGLKPYLPAGEQTEKWLLQVQLALTEAVSNVFRHAYAEQHGYIYVLLALFPDRLEVDLVDIGTAYQAQKIPTLDIDPVSPPERGYGLPIIYQVMDNVAYQRLAGGYNHWQLSCRLPDPGSRP